MKKYLTLFFATLIVSASAQKSSLFEKINMSNGLPTNYIFCVAEDTDGYIWAGSDKGLLLFDGYSWQTFDNNCGLPGNYINNIIADYKGGLWISISEHGVFWFDTKTKKIAKPPKTQNIIHTNKSSRTSYFGEFGKGLFVTDSAGNTTNYTTKNGLCSNNINQVFITKDGAVFISTLGGGINVIKYSNRVKFELENRSVRGIQFYKGNYYVNTKDAIFVLNKNKIEHKYILQKEALSFLMQNDYLYTGNFEGLQQYNFNKGKLNFVKSIANNAGISTILPSNNNFVASTYGSGLISMQNAKIIYSLDKFPFNNIEKIFPLQSGFAAVSYEKGMFTFNERFDLIKYYTKKDDGLLNNSVFYVHQYKDTLWACSNSGISCITKNKVVKTYSFSEGFNGKAAYYFFTDTAGVHWVMSDKYLHKLKGNSLKVIGNASIVLNNNDNAICGEYNAKENTLAVGTRSGIVLLSLSKITFNEQVIAPSLAEVLLNSKATDLKNNYDLPFSYNSINFRFKNINGLFRENKIFYKLENYSSTWFPLADSLSISFNKLRPNSYKLYAKTINPDGLESDILLLANIKVNQPILASWWMLVIYCLAIGVIIFLITQAINKKKYRKKIQYLELQQQLENERQRISRDLHDNMGAYTSALIASVDKLKFTNEKNSELDKMKNNAEQILYSLRETIWVLNNKEISLVNFSDDFTTFCFKVLQNFEHINFEMEEQIITNRKITAADAINVNKILQEAFQNCIKHSNCTNIKYSIIENENILISIVDNGIGFNMQLKKHGNGLENIEWRAKEIGAILSIDSKNGVSITIEIPKK